MAPQVGLEPTTLRLTARKASLRRVARQCSYFLVIKLFRPCLQVPLRAGLLGICRHFDPGYPQKSPHSPVPLSQHKTLPVHAMRIARVAAISIETPPCLPDRASGRTFSEFPQMSVEAAISVLPKWGTRFSPLISILNAVSCASAWLTGTVKLNHLWVMRRSISC